MIGNNTMEFNEATMIEAVQQYLDRELTKAVKVISVRDAGGQRYGKVFTVKTESLTATEVATKVFEGAGLLPHGTTDEVVGDRLGEEDLDEAQADPNRA
jgi:hypothetical protein